MPARKTKKDDGDRKKSPDIAKVQSQKINKNKTNTKPLPNKVHPTVVTPTSTPVCVTRAKWDEIMGNRVDTSDQDTDILEQILPIPMPDPIFDWIRLSLCFNGRTYYAPLSLFVQKFGEPESTKVFGTHCWKFSNGLYLSKDNIFYNYLLMFQADNDLLKEINIFLDVIKLARFPEARFKLYQAEIAFDMFHGKTEIEVEDIAREFSTIATPVKHKCSRTEFEGELKPMADGAINGAITVYDNKTRKTNKGHQPLRRASRHEKIYPKAIDGIWFVRFEETLKGSSLERYIGTEIPKSIYVNERQKNVNITTFWDFYRFDYDAFRAASYKIASRKLDKKEMSGLRTLLHHTEFKTASGHNLLVYKAADYINSAHLKRRIGRGDFKHPVVVFTE